ncbi:hypothetical protein ACVXHA_08310 [Escherichia coli]
MEQRYIQWGNNANIVGMGYQRRSRLEQEKLMSFGANGTDNYKRNNTGLYLTGSSKLITSH